MSFLPTDWPSFLWGAAIAAFAAFGTGFLKKAGEAAAELLKRKITSAPGVHDKELFEEFQRTLPAEPIARLFRPPDFDNPFRRADIRPLWEFVETWDKVDKEFIDKTMEGARKNFYASAEAVSTEISRLTTSIGDGSRFSVYADSARAEHRGSGRPAFVVEDAKTLNSATASFADEYEAFVRLCRAKLKSEKPS